MPDNNKPTEEVEDHSVAYATDDLGYKTIGQSAVLLILLSIFSFAIAGGAYWLFVYHETKTALPVPAIELTQTQPDPNVPILQKDPILEIRKFRADEYDEEHAYMHWKDGDGKQSLRIPISRAMEIVKQRGLAAPTKHENE